MSATGTFDALPDRRRISFGRIVALALGEQPFREPRMALQRSLEALYLQQVDPHSSHGRRDSIQSPVRSRAR